VKFAHMIQNIYGSCL